MMEYKSTLNLPRTDFPMKANLAHKESEIAARWEALGLYEKMRVLGAGRPKFILHDGPPYANGHIHIGHALNKILKDIVVRYKTLRGYDAPYIPGWDCHGLPVEHQLFKDIKKTKDQIGRVEFRKLAHDYAMKFVDIQREEFKRLGIVGDWPRPYLTLDKNYEQAILQSFASLVEKGYITRGLKPVNWCTRCETALAEAEVEYADHTSDSVFVKFAVLGRERTYLVIWTTTPWTLLANVAVAVHPDLDYVVVAHEGDQLILAKELFETVLKEKLGLEGAKAVRTLAGREMEGWTYRHPFVPRDGKVVLADYVSKEEGSGCVHTAPGHGAEDFATGLKYHLEVIMPVDERGRFDKSAGTFSGMRVFDANPLIIEELKKSGHLLASGEVVHSYPHCWRCKNPIIFRATQQWFLKIDHDGLREKVLRAIDRDVQWVPPSGKERISAMVGTRPDWCLSRQRYWGVPIPAMVCGACHEHLLDGRVIRRLADLALQEGTDAWFERDVKDFLPQGLRCRCGATSFEKSTDILDVWFDSGVSHQAVLKNNPAMCLPADLYLEGSDQHRGWFQASLIPSMAIDGVSPFRAVLTHGFVVDGEGRKMSKSLGNVIAPQKIISEFGADIVRLWVMSSDYNEDVRISQGILSFVADAYRKIRNTARFLLSNVDDFDPDHDKVPYAEMSVLDRWALDRLKNLIHQVTGGYEAYRFYAVFQMLFCFCNEDMSSIYLDILKDRLYTAARASRERRGAQTALYEILCGLTRLLAPVLPFTAEEIYQHTKKEKGENADSVHLSSWPRVCDAPGGREDDIRELDAILAFRPAILKALEDKRTEGVIGSPLEAKIALVFNDKGTIEKFRHHEASLRFIFIVSGVRLSLDEKKEEPLTVAVDRADGVKCGRCWNYTTDVGRYAEHPTICGRCVAAIEPRS